MKLWNKEQGLILLVAVLVFFTNLGAPKLFDDDEPKNAACAREMLDRGDLVVPVFNEDLRPEKPVLLYWFMAASYRVFGTTEFAARFFSAIFGVGTVLLTYHLGQRLFDRQVALWAGLIASSCLMFAVLARTATPDSTLIFFTTLAIYAFVRGNSFQNAEIPHESQESSSAQKIGDSSDRPETDWRAWFPAKRSSFLLMYAAMGLAVLTKGPIGFLMPCMVIGLFALSMGRTKQKPSIRRPKWPAAVWRELKWYFSPRNFWGVVMAMRPLTAILVVGAVALPWYGLVSVRTGGNWLTGFIGQHNVGRFLNPMEGHKGPIFYYLIAILAGFFPWSIFLPAGLVRLVARIGRQTALRPSLVLVACWIGVYVVFFSLAATKLPNYVVPAYPALALVTGCLLVEWQRRPTPRVRWWFRVALVAMAIVGIGIAIGIQVASAHILPGEAVLGLVGLILVVGAALAYWYSRKENLRPAMVTVAVTSICFVTAFLAFASERISRHQHGPYFAAWIQQTVAGPYQLGTFRCSTPSLVFYTRQRVENFWAADQVQDFFRHAERPFLITRSDQFEAIRSSLPKDVTILARKERFLRKQELVLVGRRPLHTAGRWSRALK